MSPSVLPDADSQFHAELDNVVVLILEVIQSVSVNFMSFHHLSSYAHFLTTADVRCLVIM